MPPPSLSPERAKLAEFYSARSATITPLPWQSFAPPFPHDPKRMDELDTRINLAAFAGM
jgi:hypothetical protein